MWGSGVLSTLLCATMQLATWYGGGNYGAEGKAKMAQMGVSDLNLRVAM